ncbi:MAG: hypothetical protein Q9170_004008 [Blastenia crenularia]
MPKKRSFDEADDDNEGSYRIVQYLRVAEEQSTEVGIVEDLAHSYQGVTYKVGLERGKKQRVWALAPRTKGVFKNSDLPLPNTHVPSTVETGLAPPDDSSARPYLWIGMSGAWAEPLTNAESAKAVQCIDRDEKSLRVVAPIVAGAQLKLFALVGTGDLKVPCTISNDLVFFFAEFCEPFPTSEKDKQQLWNKNITEEIAAVLETSTKQNYQPVKFDTKGSIAISFSKSLENRILNAVALERIAPKSNSLETLRTYLETTIPGLSDTPTSGSMVKFLDLHAVIDETTILQQIQEEYEAFRNSHEKSIRLMNPTDRGKAPFYLASLVKNSLKDQYNIELPLLEIMKIRSSLREQDVFLPYSLVRPFFAHAKILLRRYNYVNVHECLEDVEGFVLHTSELDKADTTSPKPSEAAWKDLIRAFRNSLKDLITQEKESITAADTVLGEVTPAGSFDEIWGKFKHASDTDSAEILLKEIARLFHHQSLGRSLATVQWLDKLVEEMDSVVS